MQFRLDRFETSLDLPAEFEHLKIKSDPKSDITPDSTLQNGIHKTAEPEKPVQFSDQNSDPNSDQKNPESPTKPRVKKSSGPRALRRRHGVNGKKYEKSVSTSSLQRRKSFNGHW